MKKTNIEARPCKYCNMPAIIHANDDGEKYIECHHMHGCILEQVHRATFNHIDESGIAIWNGDKKGLSEEEASQKKNCTTCAAFKPGMPCIMQQYHTDDCWLPKADDVIEALIDMVQQHCLIQDHKHGEDVDVLDSMALSANADAMRLLARLGKLVIKNEYGRRVIGHWVGASVPEGKTCEACEGKDLGYVCPDCQGTGIAE